jgi:diadenosine tetraphosphate (Ap4A) HIT family hydrolase
MRPEKIVLESFSNPVPHLHGHVMPRYTDGVNFPQPVWGQVQRALQYQLASGFQVSGFR